jgi:hypothetical protein
MRIRNTVDATSLRYLFHARYPPAPPLPPDLAGHSLPLLLPFSAFFYSSILFILLLFYSLLYPRPRPSPSDLVPLTRSHNFHNGGRGLRRRKLVKNCLVIFSLFHFFSSAINLGSLCGRSVGRQPKSCKKGISKLQKTFKIILTIVLHCLRII